MNNVMCICIETNVLKLGQDHLALHVHVRPIHKAINKETCISDSLSNDEGGLTRIANAAKMIYTTVLSCNIEKSYCDIEKSYFI